MKPEDIHIRIVYGWFDKLGSEGLIDFARELAKRGYDIKDDIGWKYPDKIAELLDADEHKGKAIIGFSMGANCVTWVSNRLKKPIDLGVAYDASDGIPFIMPAHLEKVSPMIKRCLCYKGTGFPVGGAQLEGPTVETVETGRAHFGNSYDERLHWRTMDALTRFDQPEPAKA